MSDDDKKLLLDAWKQVVGVQMHFNDLELRIRSFAFTVTAAFLALGGYALKDALPLSIVGTEIPLAAVVVFSAVFPVTAFYFMERWWYHPLLVGSVVEGAILEEKLRDAGIPITLGTNISKESALPNWLLGEKKLFTQDEIDRDLSLTGLKKVASDGKFYLKRGVLTRRAFRSFHKMNVFYLMLSFSLIAVAAVLSLSGERSKEPASDQSETSNSQAETNNATSETSGHTANVTTAPVVKPPVSPAKPPTAKKTS